MKKIFTLFALIQILFTIAKAQIVTEDVNFDFYQTVTNNDFANHFSAGYGLTQIQTSGITGGCLTVPDSIGWGNDNAVYCSRYKPNQGDTVHTSICFKYDSSTVNLASFQRAMSIWLVPYSDFNHYIVATVSGNKKIEILSYSWNNNPYPLLNLLHQHWYRYQLAVAFPGGPLGSVYVKAEVFDLGLTGLSAPVFVNSSSGTFSDNVLNTDTAIQVSITGTTYGGCSHLDDFHFNGRKGFSNCTIVSGLNNIATLQALQVYLSGVNNVLHVIKGDGKAEKMLISLFTPQGKKILEQETCQLESELDLSTLTNGVYLARCATAAEIRSFKIVVSK